MFFKSSSLSLLANVSLSQHSSVAVALSVDILRLLALAMARVASNRQLQRVLILLLSIGKHFLEAF